MFIVRSHVAISTSCICVHSRRGMLVAGEFDPANAGYPGFSTSTRCQSISPYPSKSVLHLSALLHCSLLTMLRAVRHVPRITALGAIPAGRALAVSSASARRSLNSTTSCSAAHTSAPSQPEAPASSTFANPAKPVDLLEVYRDHVSRGKLTWDDEQVRVVMKVSHPVPGLTG